MKKIDNVPTPLNISVKINCLTFQLKFKYAMKNIIKLKWSKTITIYATYDQLKQNHSWFEINLISRQIKQLILSRRVLEIKCLKFFYHINQLNVT